MSNPNYIFARFQQSISSHPNASAIVFKRDEKYHTWTYAQLLEEALRWKRFLSAKGIGPAEKVAVMLDNQPEFVAAFLGVMACGSTAVLLDNQLSGAQVEKFIHHSGTRFFVTNSKIFQRVGASLGKAPYCLVDVAGFSNQLNNAPALSDIVVERTEMAKTAVLFYTSGTTDQPKAVMLTHRNLLSNVDAITTLSLIKPDDRLLAFLPLHHAYAFTVTLLTPLLSGITIVYPSGLSSADLMGCLREQNITLFVGVPQVFNLIHRSVREKIKSLSGLVKMIFNFLAELNFSFRKRLGLNCGKIFFAKIHQNLGPSMRLMVSGGARLEPDIAKDFYRWGLDILEGYGLTETAPVAAFMPMGRPKFGSVGKPLPGVEIKIDAPNAEGVGEVLIKGDNVMAGYYAMPDETAKVIRDGWFYSGDLGRMDKDGYIFLVGRKKEMILLSNGKNIYPEDVEKQYSRIPFIKEIGILAGKVAGQTEAEEQLVAVIVPNEEAFRASREANMQGKLKWELDNVSLQLPSHSRIKSFVINQEPLPRTRLGKLIRYQLNTIYSQLALQTARSLQPPVEDTAAVKMGGAAGAALVFFEEKLKRPVLPAHHLELDLGLDSLNRIEMLLGIQERLGLELNDEQALKFFMCATVQELMDQLVTLAPDHAETKTPAESELNWKNILHEELSDEMKRKIKLSFGFLAMLFNFVMITFLKIIFKIFFLLRTEGLARLPKKGPYLLCPNHTSYLDGLFVMTALPYGLVVQTYFLGFKMFFESAALKPFVRVARLIPIETTHDFVESLKACAHVLNHGKIVCYFPEGQRSVDGQVTEFKKGVGILIRELGVPVVPVYLDGAFKTWPRGQKWPRLARVTVKFGPVVEPAELLPIKSNEESPTHTFEQIASRLRAEVIRLSTYS